MTFSLLSRRVVVTALLAFSFTLTIAHAQDPAPPAAPAAKPESVVKPIPTTPAEKAQAEIQSCLDKQSAAAAKKDVMGATRYIAPDFIGIASDGTKMTLGQIRAASQKTIDVVESVEILSTIDAITLKGNTATVDMTQTQKAVFRQPSGISRTLNVQSQSRCFWMKGKTGWMMKRSRVLQGGIDVDGKPIRVATPG